MVLKLPDWPPEITGQSPPPLELLEDELDDDDELLELELELELELDEPPDTLPKLM